ncbi:hypothetical protein Bca4012_059177 [Brassica carinata]
MDVSRPAFKCFDDDGRLRRSGTVWTASAHIITAVIGSGVLSLAWAIGQLGWIAGPTVMFLFSFVTYFSSTLLSDCYRTGDPVSGKRNYTYMDAVQSILGGFRFKICGLIQFLNLFGITVGYTIAASISMMAIKRSNCFHESGGKNPCHMSSNPYMIMFGVTEILLSQIKDFDQIWWLSIVAAIMSFTYSAIGLALGIIQVAANGVFKGSLTGISIGTVTQTQKIWRTFQALGDIAFAYSYSEFEIRIPGVRAPYKVNVFRAVFRSCFVVLTTVISMLMPFFNDVVGILGALGFWPLTVYFPVEMYIRQRKVERWSMKWVCLKMLSGGCLVITVVAGVGSVAGVMLDLKGRSCTSYKFSDNMGMETRGGDTKNLSESLKDVTWN